MPTYHPTVVTIAVALGFWGSIPSLPSTCATPTPSSAVAKTDQHIRNLELRLKNEPDAAVLRNGLARAYIQKARENGDASYLTRAENLLTASVTQQNPSVETLGLYAWLALFKHDFKGAAEWAEKARRRKPRDSWHYGILSDASLEMGDYRKAVLYAQTMVDLKPDQASYSRAAHLRSVHGDSDGAIDLWKAAITAGAITGESTAWCKVELGDEYFSRGRIREAELAYSSALESFPGYHRSLAGLAKVRAAQQRWTDAAALYHKAIDVIPSPQYVTALGDIYLAMDQTDNAEEQYRLVEQIARLDRLNQVQYNRDLALFYADHARKLDEAARLARKELVIRKDIYSYDILAWALYRNGQAAQAQTAMKKALHLGTKDPRLFFHAGMIAASLGQRQEATRHLSFALALNPSFHPLHRQTARDTLERLKHTSGTVE